MGPSILWNSLRIAKVSATELLPPMGRSNRPGSLQRGDSRSRPRDRQRRGFTSSPVFVTIRQPSANGPDPSDEFAANFYWKRGNSLWTLGRAGEDRQNSSSMEQYRRGRQVVGTTYLRHMDDARRRHLHVDRQADGRLGRKHDSLHKVCGRGAKPSAHGAHCPPVTVPRRRIDHQSAEAFNMMKTCHRSRQPGAIFSVASSVRVEFFVDDTTGAANSAGGILYRLVGRSRAHIPRCGPGYRS